MLQVSSSHCREFRPQQNIFSERLFLTEKGEVKSQEWTAEKVKEAGALRQIPIGVQKVAEEPTDEDFEQAAVYRIQVPGDRSSLLRITYQGDCARLYANGKLVADHFQYGRPMLYGLWRLPAGTMELELRILPLQENMPIYFTREADTTPGEQVNNVIITYQGL